MFTEALEPFFNPDEFAVIAFIKAISVPGILESSTLTINQMQCCQFKFTCAQKAIPKITREDEIKMADQTYRILEIKSDGTGLVHLLLEVLHEYSC